jgi:hypothetical protein
MTTRLSAAIALAFLATRASAQSAAKAQQYDTLVNIAAMGPVSAPHVVVPRGSPGRSTMDVREVGGTGTFADFGAFRMVCTFAKFAFDDPIVYPKHPGVSHLHMFFGNTGVNAYTTPDSLFTGNSTCAGGIANRTGYWTPAMIDTRTGTIVKPGPITIYYKSGLNVDYTKIVPLPTGLRMIAGDKNWTGPGPQTEPPQGFQFVQFVCRDGSVKVSYEESGNIPNCKVGDAVHLSIEFPQCWDGKHLDSPDHKSHMANPNYSGSVRNQTRCPGSHPVVVPQITEIFDFPVTEENAPASNWRLSSDMYDKKKKGGFSAHADWMMGWDETAMKTMVTDCLNKGRDCGVNFLGGGKELVVTPP